MSIMSYHREPSNGERFRMYLTDSHREKIEGTITSNMTLCKYTVVRKMLSNLWQSYKYKLIETD